MKHTPGPWMIDGISRDILAPDGELLATAYQMTVDVDEEMANPDDTGVANARLIAAAPELLDALKAIHEGAARTISDSGDYSYALDRILQTAEAAITKAQGRL